MAVVTSAVSIKRRLEHLNWPFQVSEVIQFLGQQSIAGSEFVAYLDAAIASGDGVDDANIPGCSAASGAKITAALKARGLMVS